MKIMNRGTAILVLLLLCVMANAESLQMAAKHKGKWVDLGGGETWKHALVSFRVETGKYSKEVPVTVKVYDVAAKFDPWRQN